MKHPARMPGGRPCFVPKRRVLKRGGVFCRFLKRLSAADPSVGAHLVAQKVDPHYFAFRWMTVLFSQDIEHLSDVLRVWDFLFGDPQGCKEAVMRFCCALLLVRCSLGSVLCVGGLPCLHRLGCTAKSTRGTTSACHHPQQHMRKYSNAQLGLCT